jgi:hypothetical protein
MGGFEPKAKPWDVEPIPDGFEFQLLPKTGTTSRSDAERDPPHALPRDRRSEAAAERAESFTLDGNFILGEAPELAAYFVCAGFNSAGIANSGGAGKLVAEWIVNGEPPLDLWDVDIRRFAPYQANRRHLSTARSSRSACITRCDGHERSSKPCGRCVAPRCTTPCREASGVRQQDELGARELLSARGAEKPPYTLGTPDGCRTSSTSSAHVATTSSSSIRRRSRSSC